MFGQISLLICYFDLAFFKSINKIKFAYYLQKTLQLYTKYNPLKTELPQMSIEKYLTSNPYIKNINQTSAFHYRLRNIPKNQSMNHLTTLNHSLKQLSLKNNSKIDLLSRINNKYTADTSFFHKEFSKFSPQTQLPKSTLLNPQKQKQKSVKIMASHRILRKVNSCQVLPQSFQVVNRDMLKQSFLKNDVRKVSLKKKVDIIKKKYIQQKSFNSDHQITQVQSENFLGEKKKSKTKLKMLVRDPFQSSKLNQKKRVGLFSESRIEPSHDMSIISETNKQQIEEYLSCLN